MTWEIFIFWNWRQASRTRPCASQYFSKQDPSSLSLLDLSMQPYFRRYLFFRWSATLRVNCALSQLSTPRCSKYSQQFRFFFRFFSFLFFNLCSCFNYAWDFSTIYADNALPTSTNSTKETLGKTSVWSGTTILSWRKGRCLQATTQGTVVPAKHGYR